MRTFLDNLKIKAQQNPKRIVFPEIHEEFILRACEIIAKEKIAVPFLIGDRYEMEKRCKEFGIDYGGFEVRDPKYDEHFEKYANEYFDLRKKKGMSLEIARKKILEPDYFAAMMVHMNDADGMISGITGENKPFLPAFEIIKTKDNFHKASGLFLMTWDDGRLLLFADCAVVIDPDAKDLAEIAIDTAETAKALGIIPKIAMLSFSTYGTAKHPFVDKVKEATELVKYMRPELIIDGEMQLDAALVPAVAKKKCPDSVIQGDANILIFPELNTGNIAYKLVERLANAHAVGPIIQGLKKPVNDLSRGCSVQDIIDVAIMTVVESQNNKT